MHICLNRATAGGSLPFDEFVNLAADAGFEGADVELGWARMRSVGALRDLFASRNLRFGGWGVPFDWRGDDEGKRRDGMKDLAQFAGYARERLRRRVVGPLPATAPPVDPVHLERLRALGYVAG